MSVCLWVRQRKEAGEERSRLKQSKHNPYPTKGVHLCCMYSETLFNVIILNLYRDIVFILVPRTFSFVCHKEYTDLIAVKAVFFSSFVCCSYPTRTLSNTYKG